MEPYILLFLPAPAPDHVYHYLGGHMQTFASKGHMPECFELCSQLPASVKVFNIF